MHNGEGLEPRLSNPYTQGATIPCDVYIHLYWGFTIGGEVALSCHCMSGKLNLGSYQPVLLHIHVICNINDSPFTVVITLVKSGEDECR